MSEKACKDSYTFSGFKNESIFYEYYNIQVHLETRVTFYIQSILRVWVYLGLRPLATTVASATLWKLIANPESGVPDTFQVAFISES